MGHKHSKPKENKIINKVGTPKSYLLDYVYKHNSIINSKPIGILALRSNSNVANLTNRKEFLNFNDYDVAIIEGRQPTTSELDAKCTLRYLQHSKKFKSTTTKYGDYILIGIVESYNYYFSHNISFRYSFEQNNVEYYVISIKFTSLQDENINPFTVLIIKTFKPPKSETYIENGVTITKTVYSLTPSLDNPLPKEIVNNIDEFASKVMENESWYIINYNNNPHCLEKYMDRTLALVDV
ncbi:putative orfan [Tupanvirus soda lake]|uniref:Orfan n=2 Tax=Tupanvirus TaxID=2094720 RepID=A0AC62AE03_9VIRU|nr:putative orfan [Tupanvirus soda lake]QKU35966.1 putative orfan [Tupanvirus soda lake]